MDTKQPCVVLFSSHTGCIDQEKLLCHQYPAAKTMTESGDSVAIGYACAQVGGEAAKLVTLRLANATPDAIRAVIEKNLDALSAMLRYNADHGIGLFRISSDIIPFASHPAMTVDWRSEFGQTLRKIGQYIRDNGMRVSMHPGQYTVLNSPRAEVVQRAAEDLQYHAGFLDALGCDATCKIVVHIGGVYSGKQQAMDRFVTNYRALNERIRARLVIENDDRSYTAEDAVAIAKQTGMPVVFDVLHHKLNHGQSELSPFTWIDRCGRTWAKRDGKQKIHYAQSDPDRAAGAHARRIRAMEFLEFYNGLHDQTVDVMLEVKDKNLSAVKCRLLTQKTLKIGQLESEWARYKYLVLSRSAAIYGKIRTLLQNKSAPDALRFYTLIEDALALQENRGAQVNAAQHMWGYLRDAADEKAHKRFAALLLAYRQETGSRKAMQSFLFRLAKQQQCAYLLESLYFYLE